MRSVSLDYVSFRTDLRRHMLEKVTQPIPIERQKQTVTKARFRSSQLAMSKEVHAPILSSLPGLFMSMSLLPSSVPWHRRVRRAGDFYGYRASGLLSSDVNPGYHLRQKRISQAIFAGTATLSSSRVLAACPARHNAMQAIVLHCPLLRPCTLLIVNTLGRETQKPETHTAQRWRRQARPTGR
jgi:hypothetical protein